MALKMDESHGVSKKSKKYGRPTRQAEVAKEILELYDWWEGRDSRPDPSDVSGWSESCDKKISEEETLKSFRKMEALEKKYDKEDDDMLARLLSIRRDLWC
jgi:hypothetical protein